MAWRCGILIGCDGDGHGAAGAHLATGASINSTLADHVVAVNADVPPIEVHFLDFPDKEINALLG